jgi:phenylpropionate dioxygenase-like ring-hydroxylating dioxygenase large terminal subunit
MLTKQDNDLITNTDRGTPMGELFRRFWLPVALASELPGPDSTPIRVRVLNEDLIAFRDSNSQVGLVDAYCPHRGAPMFFGRNEEAGLRCVYHGWKFDVDGNCVDLPNAPEGETFKNKVRITSYPCVDAGDLIWAYLGPADRKPPFPEFEWCKMTAGHRYVLKFRLECNYLQAMEGDGDQTHAPFLHSKLEDGSRIDPLNDARANVDFRDDLEFEPFPRAVGKTRRVTPELGKVLAGKIEESDSGAFFLMTRDLPDSRKLASASPWMMPVFLWPGIAGPNTYSSNIRIPIDNRSIMFYRLRWSYTPIPEKDINEYKTGAYYYPTLIPGTFRTEDNLANNYNVDRVAQKYFSYTGIKTFPLQDIAMIENQWGPLADRTKEHLTSMDNWLIYVRRRLLKTAKALAEGIEPSEPWHPEAYAYHSESVITEASDEEALELAKAKAKEMRIKVNQEKVTVQTGQGRF